MRTFSTKFTGVLTVLALSLATSYAFAGNGNKNKGGLGISFGGGNGGVGIRLNNGNHNNHNNGNYNHHCGSYNNYNNYNSYPYNNYPYDQQFGQAYEPFHSFYICQPGDSFYTVSLKEYGTSAVMNKIAQFNRLAPNAALVPGQRVMLPSVNANGMLTQSRAPAPFVDATTQSPVAQSTAKFTPATTSPVTSNLVSDTTVAATEPALPSVAVGSTLVLDGQTFGDKQGVARLRIGGLSLPVVVLEWTNSSAKVRLPEVELTSPMKAEIEVLRADGSLASKTAIDLTPAADRLALQN